MSLSDQLHGLTYSIAFIVPELILMTGIVALLIVGMAFPKNQFVPLQLISLLVCILSSVTLCMMWPKSPTSLFQGMLRYDDYSSYFKLLADAGGLITVIMTHQNRLQKHSEYFLLMMTVVVGAHVLVMSMNFVMIVLSMELLSISSYALAGWSFTKTGTEGSLKYFLFGSVATASMLYGISLLYGLTGTLDFSSEKFVTALIDARSPVLFVGGLMTLAGFLFKMSAAPMHLWAPDVYQSATTPIVAFLSVVPKIAGFGALIKFLLAINLFGQSGIDWQLVLAAIAALSITVGNFSALWQTNPKRLLAYSSIAQSGFLLAGLVPMTRNGVHATLFYGTILLLMNFLTFVTVQQFERDGFLTIPSLAGQGRTGSFRSLALTTGLISLVGLPLTAGFSAKLFIFTGLWEAYSQSHTMVLIVLLVFGLINTVISLFYYLRIPYYLFIKESTNGTPSLVKLPFAENLLSSILVILLLALFFRPDILMGWIIRVNFVL